MIAVTIFLLGIAWLELHYGFANLLENIMLIPDPGAISYWSLRYRLFWRRIASGRHACLQELGWFNQEIRVEF